MKFGPTKRSSLFVDAILTPISQSFCGNEYLKDTPHFLQKLSDNEQKLCSPGVQLFTLDVKALYPSINLQFLPDAVAAALDAITEFSSERKEFIRSLATFNIQNAVVHFKGQWFKAVNGVPTGGSDSVCLANIYLKWVLIKFFLTHVNYKQFIVCLIRFIDDVFGGWLGTYRQFKQFVSSFNLFAKDYGINFDKHSFGDTVNFLDVIVSNNTGVIVTDLYIKPTDSCRYLHRTSFHPKHTFTGIPFSQMRRAMLICSTPYLQEFAIDEMVSNFLKCGYEQDLLLAAKTRALSLLREELLTNLLSNNRPINSNISATPLCFVVPYSLDVEKVKEFVHSLSTDIYTLTGSRQVIFSQKRNRNTGSFLFNKYGFAQLSISLPSQKCGANNCSSCALKLPNNNSIQILPQFYLKPSSRANCKTDNIIYAALCKLCNDFYFGQSINEEHTRMNGHRNKFTEEDHVKSALAMHLFTDHPGNVGNNQEDGLSNFNVVILESVNPINLKRRESFYIWSTEADIRHLNRYKIVR